MKAEHAWAGMAAGILAYEVLCRDGEMLTDAAHRAVERHPLITRAVIGAFALHLMRVVPEKADPVHHLSKIIR